MRIREPGGRPQAVRRARPSARPCLAGLFLQVGGDHQVRHLPGGPGNRWSGRTHPRSSLLPPGRRTARGFPPVFRADPQPRRKRRRGLRFTGPSCRLAPLAPSAGLLAREVLLVWSSPPAWRNVLHGRATSDPGPGRFSTFWRTATMLPSPATGRDLEVGARQVAGGGQGAGETPCQRTPVAPLPSTGIQVTVLFVEAGWCCPSPAGEDGMDAPVPGVVPDEGARSGVGRLHLIDPLTAVRRRPQGRAPRASRHALSSRRAMTPGGTVRRRRPFSSVTRLPPFSLLRWSRTSVQPGQPGGAGGAPPPVRGRARGGRSAPPLGEGPGATGTPAGAPGPLALHAGTRHLSAHLRRRRAARSPAPCSPAAGVSTASEGTSKAKRSRRARKGAGGGIWAGAWGSLRRPEGAYGFPVAGAGIEIEWRVSACPPGAPSPGRRSARGCAAGEDLLRSLPGWPPPHPPNSAIQATRRNARAGPGPAPPSPGSPPRLAPRDRWPAGDLRPGHPQSDACPGVDRDRALAWPGVEDAGTSWIRPERPLTRSTR